jgi:hypothetical protein
MDEVGSTETKGRLDFKINTMSKRTESHFLYQEKTSEQHDHKHFDDLPGSPFVSYQNIYEH